MGGGNSSCITVVNNPNKRTYVEGERLSLNGMQIKYFTSNKVPELIENYITYPSKDSVLSREDNTVIVQYTSLDGDIFKTALSINVKYPVRIEVIYLPKSAYKRNDVVDITGIIAEVVYNDDSRERINESQLTTTPAIGSPVEDNKVIIFSYTHNNIEYKYYYDLNKTSGNTNSVSGVDIVTFASGTWEEIEKMLKAYRSGKLDMEDYWKVGDVRSADKSEPFNDELVVLGFNSRLDQYAGKNHVLIGNKTISRSKSNYGIYGSNTLGMKMFGNATHIWFKSSFSPYDDDYYSELDNQLKTSAVNKLIMTNTTAEDSSIFSTYAGNYVSMYSVSRDGANIALGTTANYANKKIRVYKYNDIFENNAFEYYKVASNRVKTQNSVPTKYIIDNYLVNTNGLTVLNYGAASPACITYSYSSETLSGSISMYTNAPESYNMKYIARYIDIDGTQKECNVSENLGFAYYFAIG